MTTVPNFYVKARAETAALLNYDLARLTPDQSLRLDCAAALRMALDDLQGRVVRGETIDVTRMLTASEALSRLLPPAALREPPAEQREDHEAAVAPLLRLYRHLHEEVARLGSENARLKARLGITPAFADERDTPSIVDSPNAGDVVPPSEWRGELNAVPGLDDPPRRSTQVIEAKAVPPAPAASAAPQTWDESPHGKAWQAWCDAGGPGFDRWSNRNE